MIHALVHINARLQPTDRGEWFEDPLDAVLREQSAGEVTGGGTLQADNGEIQSCDIEVELRDSSTRLIDWLVTGLENLGAPRGSKLILAEAGVERPFGQAEGMAIYLNGTDLGADVYSSCDINVVVSECEERLGEDGRRLSHWEGSEETALYFYGASFAQMKAKVSPFLAAYPLSKNCRVIQNRLGCFPPPDRRAVQAAVGFDLYEQRQGFVAQTYESCSLSL